MPTAEGGGAGGCRGAPDAARESVGCSPCAGVRGFAWSPPRGAPPGSLRSGAAPGRVHWARGCGVGLGASQASGAAPEGLRAGRSIQQALAPAQQCLLGLYPSHTPQHEATTPQHPP